MKRLLLPLMLLSSAAMPVGADTDRVAKGAVIGGVIGLAAGEGLRDAIGGAIVGGGVAAITDTGRKGKRARKGAAKGAVVGAAIGGIAGDGLRDALKGAVIGGAAGGIISR